jgi:AcrR family transcriptional regulator
LREAVKEKATLSRGSSTKLGASDGQPSRGARERILRTAYELFCRHGIGAIGIDRIIAEAGVAKMTLYRLFRSKEELVLAVLDLREEIWTRGWLGQVIEQRGQTADERLLVIFDAFEEWFRRKDYEGCLFTNALLEIHDPTNVVGSAAAEKRENIRVILRVLAEQAGVRDPDEFACQWQMLMTGSIVSAMQGDKEAARHAREAAARLLERERQGP